MRAIFEYENYREYMMSRLGGENRRTGQRMAAAKALGCHSTFVSLVLKERAHLSIEQAFRMNHYFGHPKLESEYFINLVQKDRAGCDEVKSYFAGKLEELRKKRTEIKDRIKSKKEISKLDQARFYSDWLYGAIHVLTSIPGKDSVEEVARHFNISIQLAYEVVQFLLDLGLVKNNTGRLEMGTSHIHLGSDSALIDQHHKNWRICAVSKLGQQRPRGVHYSAAFSLSRNDAEILKEEFMQNLQKVIQRVQKSEAQLAYCYNFDFFQL